MSTSTLIELHKFSASNPDADEKIVIVADKIRSLQQRENYTEIIFDNGDVLLVTERLDDILKGKYRLKVTL